jgi:hypothetical protein
MIWINASNPLSPSNLQLEKGELSYLRLQEQTSISDNKASYDLCQGRNLGFDAFFITTEIDTKAIRISQGTENGNSGMTCVLSICAVVMP